MHKIDIVTEKRSRSWRATHLKHKSDGKVIYFPQYESFHLRISQESTKLRALPSEERSAGKFNNFGGTSSQHSPDNYLLTSSSEEDGEDKDRMISAISSKNESLLSQGSFDERIDQDDDDNDSPSQPDGYEINREEQQQLPLVVKQSSEVSLRNFQFDDEKESLRQNGADNYKNARLFSHGQSKIIEDNTYEEQLEVKRHRRQLPLLGRPAPAKLQIHIETSQSSFEKAPMDMKYRQRRASDFIYTKLMRKFNGIFYCHEQEYEYALRSFWCLSDENTFRKSVVWLVTWQWFNYFIIICILANSFLLAATDYEIRLDPNYESDWMKTQDVLDLCFTFIFIAECVLKICAKGFISHKNSYLNDSWNRLDFFIVLVSILSMLPFGSETNSLKGLRAFRILRPLKSINQIPSMRHHIESLLHSIPGLTRVVCFIVFFFFVFAIFGTNQFQGQQYQFCRATEEATFDNDGNFFEWIKLGKDDPKLCQTDLDCQAAFPDAEIAICGTVFEKYGLSPLEYDGIRNIELVMYGIPGFDSVGQAFLTIFQVLSLESWVYLMYNYSETGSPIISVIFFVLLVLMGAFFTMNLVLAIIVDSYDRIEDQKLAKTEEYEKLETDESQKSSSQSNSGGDSQSQSESIDKKSQSAKIKDRILDKSANSLDSFGLVKKQEALRKTETEQDQDDLEISKRTQDGSVVNETEEYDELEYERDARRSSHDNRVYRFFYKFVTSATFNFSIYLIIFANSMTLASYTYDLSEVHAEHLKFYDNLFTYIFLLEMICKLIGLGFQNYKKDLYNIFDACIVIISLIDVAISHIPGFTPGTFLKALRALRMLRMLKLAKTWEALDSILKKTVQSFIDISAFGILLLIFIYIFALLGIELFSNIALVDEYDNLVIGSESIQALYSSGDYYTFPRDNFNNLGYAITTVFIVIMGEDWNWTMYQWVRAYGYGSDVSHNIAIFYFVILMVLGNIILFSLFTAILLRNFEDDDEKVGDGQQEVMEKIQDSKKDLEENSTCFQNFRRNFEQMFGKKKKMQVQEKTLKKSGVFISFKSFQNIQTQKSAENYIIQNKAKNMPQIKENVDKNSSFESVQSNELDDYQYDKSAHEAFSRKKTLFMGINRNMNKYMRQSSLIHYDVENSKIKLQGTIVFQKNSEDGDELQELKGTSLLCLSKTNSFRLCCKQIVEGQVFTTLIILLILISTCTLACESPLDDPLSQKIETLNKIDLVMTTSFTIELVLKVITYGFYFAGDTSYIRDTWNLLDFFIVVCALLGIFLGNKVDIQFLKSLRTARLLRPLRLITRNRGLKIAISSLISSIPNISRLMLVVLFYLFLLAVLQTSILSGEFQYCHIEHLKISKNQEIQNIKTMWDCHNYGGEWINPDLNFDTVMNSFLTLVAIQSTECWINVLWNSIDAVNPYYQPQQNHHPFMVIYMMLLIILICMLFIEMFIGIAVQAFNSQKELITGNTSLQRTQVCWVKVHMMCMDAIPIKKIEADGLSRLRDFCVNVTESIYFESFIMFVILANTLILTLNWYMQPDNYLLPLSIINYIFIAIFTIELIMKLIAQRLSYFKSSWNIFDFIVVIMTAVLLFISIFSSSVDQNMASMLRILRICRLLRLLKKSEQLNTILMAVSKVSPTIGSLAILFTLFLFMFSIISVQLFAMINIDGAAELSEHANFQSFGTAFITLLRCSTGEAWNIIMFDLAQQNSILFRCVEDEDYDQIVDSGRDPNDPYGPRGCGSSVSIVFHLTFQVIISQIFLNLFIASFLEAFFGQSDIADLPIKQSTIEEFSKIWVNYDKEAHGFISVDDLCDLLVTLAKQPSDQGGSLILFKSRIINSKSFLRRQLMALEIPTYERMQKVMFYDVLMKLCHQVVKYHLQKDQITNIKRNLGVLRMTGSNVLYADTLEAINNRFAGKKQVYDKEMAELFCEVDNKNPKAELVREITAKNKILRQIYNDKVDTWPNVLDKKTLRRMVTMKQDQLQQIDSNKSEDSDGADDKEEVVKPSVRVSEISLNASVFSDEQLKSRKNISSKGSIAEITIKAELYTTKHLVSAELIYEQILQHIEDSRTRKRNLFKQPSAPHHQRNKKSFDIPEVELPLIDEQIQVKDLDEGHPQVDAETYFSKSMVFALSDLFPYGLGINISHTDQGFKRSLVKRFQQTCYSTGFKAHPQNNLFRTAQKTKKVRLVEFDEDIDDVLVTPILRRPQNGLLRKTKSKKTRLEELDEDVEDIQATPLQRRPKQIVESIQEQFQLPENEPRSARQLKGDKDLSYIQTTPSPLMSPNVTEEQKVDNLRWQDMVEQLSASNTSRRVSTVRLESPIRRPLND